ncbi:MAG: DNA-packaging protein [Candidatus Pacearchaeota archaeon]|nr:DNA-packaging protein [Candidatus Pacearchaeota archaeon]
MTHPGGRPPLYNDPEEMAIAIADYFLSCDNNQSYRRIKNKDGEMETVTDPAPIKYTLTGLAIHLGFESRQSLYDYKGKEEFSYVIKRAILRIEYQVEMEVRERDKPTGAIFVLKNMGWSDKTEIEHTGLKEVPSELVVKHITSSE